jgi:hypothetical protein
MHEDYNRSLLNGTQQINVVGFGYIYIVYKTLPDQYEYEYEV